MNRIEIHGVDISDLLIEQAVQKGVPSDRLRVADATSTDYLDREFDYSYSIGSLEHFTEQGLEDCLRENARVTRFAAFHMVPVSRSGADEGWTERTQSYFNNSVEWWQRKYSRDFKTVLVLDSGWEDDISLGKWFVCYSQ